MKIYVTKYCLTEGITEEEANCDSEYPGMAHVKGARNGYCDRYFHGKEWHTTMEAAKRNAYDRCQAKIKSVEKQLAKLRAMKFD